ncbi:hypothetical protein ABZ467_32060 [Streptomyces sp. NPDC005727]|uniref:hypothetical protein n=1 Tax=Streptomyces sp. NPDC005727 TaxID=3157053 RepID=UPI0033D856DA
MTQEPMSPQEEPSSPTPWWRRVKVWILGLLTAVVSAWLVSFISTGKAPFLGSEGDISINEEDQGPVLNVGVEPGSGGECGEEVAWVYPKSPTDPLMNTSPGRGPRVDGKTWDEDPKAFGAAPAGPAWLSIAATTTSERVVIITNIAFHVVERKSPVKGTVVSPSRACGNGALYHFGRVNFDTQPPYWEKLDADDYPQEIRADDLKFPYKASASDPAILHIEVDPGKCRCSWYAEVFWKDGEKSDKTRLPKSGAYETTPSKGLPAFEWTYEGERSPVPW